MASVGAGRRQGEGVQDWAPVEEAKGRAGRSATGAPSTTRRCIAPSRSIRVTTTLIQPILLPSRAASGGQPRSFSMTTRSSHTPFTDRPALDPEARLSD